MTQPASSPAGLLGEPMPCGVLLRRLREAAGLSRDAWSARIGYGRATVQRWEQGETVPDARAEAALVTACGELGLFRSFGSGLLLGITLTSDVLRRALAEARTPSMAPAPTQLRAAPPDHFPAPLTSFLGRVSEVAEVVALVRETRLVTLTGAGGVGKTRLAIEAASVCRASFDDGVAFVALAGIDDPALVEVAIGRAIGVTQSSGPSLIDGLEAALRGRRQLLLLDNFEQVVAAAPLLVELLSACPSLRLLVTSRAVLRVSSERVHVVGPLAVPSSGDRLEGLDGWPVLDLFVQRARSARSDFNLGPDDVAAVAEICRRLDGLPLAIELAAARTTLLPVWALLKRLSSGLEVLADGPRDSPARHRSLHDTISWSHTLLSAAERVLFRRLAIFAGGCTLGAAEIVCEIGGEIDVFSSLANLVEQSLVIRQDGAGPEPRFVMLETIRAYALEQLQLSGETDAVYSRLADYLTTLAQQGDNAAPAQLILLDLEYQNIQVALGWCLLRDVGRGVRLIWSLFEYWREEGHRTESLQWRQRFLSLPSMSARRPERARLLACWTSPPTSDVSAAQRDAELEEAVALAREFGDDACRARALFALSFQFQLRGDFDALQTVALEALTLLEGLGMTRRAAQARLYLANAATMQGRWEQAERLVLDNLELARSTSGAGVVRHAMRGQANLAMARGEYAQARTILEKQVQLYVDQGRFHVTLLRTLLDLAWVTMQQGDWNTAMHAARENLAYHQSMHVWGDLWSAVDIVGQLAIRLGATEAGVRLLGAASDAPLRSGAVRWPFEEATFIAAVESARATLGHAAFASAWQGGVALSSDASVAESLLVLEQLQAQQ